MIKRFFKDPFFHFMVIAALIYVSFDLFHSKEKIGEKAISQIEIKAMKLKWEKEWGRPATEAELESLIRKKEQDEILFKKAIDMELYKDDPVIFKRLLDKMKHVVLNIELSQQPNDTKLREYYKKHIDNYREDGIFSFSQVFISTDHNNPIQKANELLVLLRETDIGLEEIDQFGDPFKHRNIKNADKQRIGQIFGKGFYKQLRELKISTWSEPIISDFGVHLIFMTNHSLGKVLPYDSVKDIVMSDFIQDAKKRYLENL